MKKFLSLLLAVAMIASLFTVNVFADGEPALTITADGPIKAGSTIDVTLSFENNPGLWYGKIVLGFDNTKFELVDYEHVMSSMPLADSSLVPGKSYSGGATASMQLGSATSQSAFDESGVIGVLTFRALDDTAAGVYNVTVDTVEFYDMNEDDLVFIPNTDSLDIEVKGAWTATGFDVIPAKTVALGTAVADLGLPTTVTVTDGANSEERDVEAWTCAAYKEGTAAVAGTYTFKATLKADDSKFSVVDGVIPEVTVTTEKIAATATLDIVEDINEVADEAGMRGLLPETVDVSAVSAGFTFTAKPTITWTVDETSTGFSGLAGDWMTFTGTVEDTAAMVITETLKAKINVISSLNPDHVVAKVGKAQYASLAAAVTDIKDGKATGEIVLQKDTNEADLATIDTDVTIDLNGYIYGGDIKVVDPALVTFKGNGTVNGDITGDITVENGAFYGTITGAVTASGGSFLASTNVNAVADANGVEKQVTVVDGRQVVINKDVVAATSLSLEFVQAGDDAHVYDIILKADNGVINEFVSAQFTFVNESTTKGGKMLYTIAGADKYATADGAQIGTDADAKITAVRALQGVDKEGTEDVNVADATKQTWDFNIVGMEDHNDNGIAATIKLGTITFDPEAYGTIKLSTNAGVVHTNTVATNIEFQYVVDGNTDIDKNKLDITNSNIGGTGGVEITPPTRKVVVKVEFPNDIKAAVDVNYNDMKVSVVGEYPGFAEIIADKDDDEFVGEVALGNDNTNILATAEFKVYAGYRYTFTVEGAGYRTARYTTIVDEADTDLTLTFWNNVKNESGDPYKEIEVGVSGLTAKNFLAGDIAMDNIIDKYDLAAVVSYFGTYNLAADNKPEYVKYDLNRDGKIDSEDIAYVLYSIGE